MHEGIGLPEGAWSCTVSDFISNAWSLLRREWPSNPVTGYEESLRFWRTFLTTGAENLHAMAEAARADDGIITQREAELLEASVYRSKPGESLDLIASRVLAVR